MCFLIAWFFNLIRNVVYKYFRLLVVEIPRFHVNYVVIIVVRMVGLRSDSLDIKFGILDFLSFAYFVNCPIWIHRVPMHWLFKCMLSKITMILWHDIELFFYENWWLIDMYHWWFFFFENYKFAGTIYQMVGPLPGPCVCGSFSAPGCPYKFAGDYN